MAGVVALVGRSDSLLGTAFFLFGVPISGATVLPEFMPTAARVFGQALPTGAGAPLVRDSLYFPSSSTTTAVITLSLYAGVGLLLVLVTNALANRSQPDHLLEVAHHDGPKDQEPDGQSRLDAPPHPVQTPVQTPVPIR